MTHKWLSMEYVGGEGGATNGWMDSGGGGCWGVGWRSKVM